MWKSPVSSRTAGLCFRTMNGSYDQWPEMVENHETILTVPGTKLRLAICKTGALFTVLSLCPLNFVFFFYSFSELYPSMLLALYSWIIPRNTRGPNVILRTKPRSVTYMASTPSMVLSLQPLKDFFDRNDVGMHHGGHNWLWLG